MIRNNNSIIGITKTTRRAALGCLLLFFLAGNALAQNSNDPHYVIKRTVNNTDHYLSHVKLQGQINDSIYWYWVLRDVSDFHPDSCLWQSGPNVEYNYYFVDHLGKYRYLSAPLERSESGDPTEGQLYLSPHPGSALNNTSENYYFYDWDHGVARGLKHEVPSGELVTCQNTYNVPTTLGECWEVVWVSYEADKWQMGSVYGYNPTANAAPFRYVTITPHNEEISEEAGGITGLVINDFSLEHNQSQTINIGTVSNYTYNLTPAYTIYDIEAVNKPPYYVYSQELHYFYDNTDHYPNGAAPSSSPHTGTVSGYEWSLSGEGAGYLELTGGNTASPTITCTLQNETTSHKFATLTLTVTYQEEGSDPVTQTCTATITVLAQCQNPIQASAPVVTYEDVTVSWVPTATHYKVYWRIQGEMAWNNCQEVLDGATSCRITGLEYGRTYDYTVTAYCGSDYLPIPDAGSDLIYSFTTKSQPNGLIYGAVFGGGRMANVGGKTEVVIINCDSIGAVYGGNDIAGAVQGNNGSDGSTITLGVIQGDAYASTYGITQGGVRVGSVYGGGNGYYAYNGTSFVPATNEYNSQTVAPGASVKAMTPSHQVGDPVWTNEGTDPKTLQFPTIVKTAINVAEKDNVKVDSLFGGAKNAFLTTNTGNGSTIIIKGGTIFAVFGGNNFGGTQGYGKHHIEVQGTKVSTATEGYGTDFGIGYLFGGGNKVYGSTTEIFITGGRCDTVFAGGNAASVYAANLTVNCAPGDHASSGAYGKIFSNAISGYSEEDGITVNSGYAWDGTGIYNVRALFGGNNQAAMASVPSIFLTSGGIGTVYGGGNAGDMTGMKDDGSIEFTGVDEIDDYTFNYSTYVLMNSPTIVVDYLYGGCQMSNVSYSTWVQLQNGHVGTVYGGCNISGDVGSTRVHLDATPFNPPTSTNPNPLYQEVYGATYVEASGGTVYTALFAGSNGYYHCKDSYGIAYIDGIDYGDTEHRFIGMNVPTHNETHVIVSGDVLVKGNVYAGGNLACVGFDQKYVDHTPYDYPSLVGLASIRMCGGTVNGNVFGGGNMASIYGSNEVRVWGGSIGMANNGALYGGNDRTGKAGQISNRVLPAYYNTASDNFTSLHGVSTYVGVSGNPQVNTIYGGGNGNYAYFTNFNDANNYHGPKIPVVTCIEGDLPIQKDIFVDVAIKGGNDGGYVANVFGGGNGVTIEGFTKVFVNVQNPGTDTRNHVGTIYGGNNEGDLKTTLPDIILLHGNVGTVYGGCNSGAMRGSHSYTIGSTTYNNLGSLVYLRSSYPGPDGDVTPDAKVTGFVYGGCRMNGVFDTIHNHDEVVIVPRNTLVYVEHGDHHTATIFGGSDISGDVSGTAQVIVTGGSVGDVYGGGNGNYNYSSGTFSGLEPPYCYGSTIDMTGGTAANLYAGGYAGMSGSTHLQMGGGTVSNKVFGGGNEAGTTTMNITGTAGNGSSTIEMTGGTVGAGIYGGCNTTGTILGNTSVTLTGGTIGSEEHLANVHGGGYGQPTRVTGNVLINYGQVMYDENTSVEIHNDNLHLYGDLYGGSALGDVNTNAENTTTIHVDNGTIHGNVYGGGLGYKDVNNSANDVEAMVYGVVHVYVGGTDGTTLYGMASFDHGPDNDRGSVFGCNNLNGSPQDNVFVDVYKTNHTTKDMVGYTSDDREYAINQLFGGGNQSDYAPEGGDAASTRSTNVHIHRCENTIENVFGGSNAANSNSVSTIVEGGRFDYIFGGGNGILSEANVGTNPAIHHTYSQIQGGRVGWCFGGSNRLGSCINIEQDLETQGMCDELIIDYFFQGGNIADQYGEMLLTLDCAEAKKYLAAYGGCRLGTVYGNITVIMTGGIIGSLFGGNQGDADHPAHVKRFPTQEEINAASPGTYPQALLNFINTQLSLGNDWRGKGGNITVIVKGGAIGNLYGGCDTEGNVDGKITVIVESEENSCGLFIGNVYGASNHTPYQPEHSDIVSPKVDIIKGTIGGGYDGFNETPDIQEDEIFEGNVFGGGNVGLVESNPKVNIGDGTDNKPVTIKGSVYGGGNNGNVVGSPQVKVVPDTRFLSVTSDHGTVTVGSNAQSLTSTYLIGEDVDINIVATADEHYAFDKWTFTGNGASVGDTTLANTVFTMGTANATLTANYLAANKLTLVADPTTGGTFKVNGVAYTGPVWIAPGQSVTVVTTPESGYNFSEWTLTGAGSSLTDYTTTTTHFRMGSEDATLTAHFARVYTLTLESSNENCTFMVDGVPYVRPVSMVEGATVSIQASPDEGFTSWTVTGTGASVGNATSATTTFTMGAGNATVTANYGRSRESNNNRNTRR